MGVLLIPMGGIALLAVGVWLMTRVERADQRKIERLRQEWEASGMQKPWTWDCRWDSGSGG